MDVYTSARLHTPAAPHDYKVTTMKTLVLPTVSCANVPQLACDLLVHTLELKLIERLASHQLHPFAAPREDPGGEPGVCTALELLGDADQVLVVSQRSPPLPGFEDAFVETLIVEVKKHSVDRIVLLTSADATYRNDEQLRQGPLVKLDLEHVMSQLSLSDDVDGDYDHDEEEGSGKLHGTGELRRLLSAINALRIQVECVCIFAHQGDNRADAAHMANHVLEMLGRQKYPLKEPPSWQTLFGPPLGQDGAGMFW